MHPLQSLISVGLAACRQPLCTACCDQDAPCMAPFVWTGAYRFLQVDFLSHVLRLSLLSRHSIFAIRLSRMECCMPQALWGNYHGCWGFPTTDVTTKKCNNLSFWRLLRIHACSRGEFVPWTIRFYLTRAVFQARSLDRLFWKCLNIWKAQVFRWGKVAIFLCATFSVWALAMRVFAYDVQKLQAQQNWVRNENKPLSSTFLMA